MGGFTPFGRQKLINKLYFFSCSLSVIATDLLAEQETEVRDFIFKKLSRGTVYGGSGNVSRVDVG